jgi:hypothetical protein
MFRPALAITRRFSNTVRKYCIAGGLSDDGQCWSKNAKVYLYIFIFKLVTLDGIVIFLNIKKCDGFRCLLLSFGDLFCPDSGPQSTVKGS